MEAPGSKVRQKAGLYRSILDQGWGKFWRQLDYKLTWTGGWLIVVPPHNPSRTCPGCGHVATGNRRIQALFLCEECWYENHADEVGAINILGRALAMLAAAPHDTHNTHANQNQRPDMTRIACEVSGEVMPPEFDCALAVVPSAHPTVPGPCAPREKRLSPYT